MSDLFNVFKAIVSIKRGGKKKKGGGRHPRTKFENKD